MKVARKDIALIQAAVVVTIFGCAAANLIADRQSAALNTRIRLD